jgi:hypothetical protein
MKEKCLRAQNPCGLTFGAMRFCVRLQQLSALLVAMDS